MDPALTSARHFVRLVRLLVREAGNVEEQKATLRALVLATKECALTLAASGDRLLASGSPVPPAFAGVPEVLDRMAAHGVAAVETDVAAGPAELLGVARLLAGPHTANDFGAGAMGLLSALNAPHVRFTVRGDPAALPELELLDISPDVPDATPRKRPVAADAARPAGGMFDQFGAAPSSSATPEQLLAELVTVTDSTRLDHLLDYLVQAAERALLENKPGLVAEIMHGMVQRDAGPSDATERRLLALALRKLARTPLLHAVARQVPRAPERRDQLLAVLTRMGEEGADALIELLANATQQSDRRAYFDALVTLQTGIPTLIHMLGDTRWFVARNAADLLGEMQAKEAEQPLTWLLQNADERVRRSATVALMRLGTPRALQAIHDALKDASPQVRIQAAIALATRQEIRHAAPLVKALDVEKDEEVQDAFLLALGRIGTPDAVQRLIAAAEAERGFFKSKRAGYRVAAVQGLAEAKTAEAKAALTALLGDKDSDMRDAVTFALGRMARQTQEIPRPS